jgi:hypothetical protein
VCATALSSTASRPYAADRGRVSRVTEAGLADIRQWLATGDVDHTVRLEPLLRSFFYWLVPPAESAGGR